MRRGLEHAIPTIVERGEWGQQDLQPFTASVMWWREEPTSTGSAGMTSHRSTTAERASAHDVVTWLLAHGAKRATELIK